MSRHVFEYIQRALFGNCVAVIPDVYDYDTSMPPWVLHVEDDALFSAALKTRLESHGVAVIRAFDGIDGIRNAFKHPADAIILDVEMPNGSGDEVLRLLKETESTRDIPVILLTCRNDRAFKQKMLNMGAVAYLNKPLEFSELQRELAKHIDILPETTTRTTREEALV